MFLIHICIAVYMYAARGVDSWRFLYYYGVIGSLMVSKRMSRSFKRGDVR
jgi:hypothetical protein